MTGGRPPRLPLFGSLALVCALETLFAAAVPALLLTRLAGAQYLVGVVIGAALGLGLLATPAATARLGRGAGRAVVAWCAAGLLVSGALSLTPAGLPVAAVVGTALVFGVARAVAMLALLTEVGRLGPASPGQGLNSAAQRLGSGLGGLAAGWVVAGERYAAGAALLAAGAGVVVLLSRWSTSGPAGAPPAVSVPLRRRFAETGALLRRDRAVQAASLVNLLVWLCVIVGNSLVPVALLDRGWSAGSTGAGIVVLVLLRDLTSAAAGATCWPLVRRLPVAAIVAGATALQVAAVVVMLAGGFGIAGLAAASVLSGAAVAVGIACANVVATSASWAAPERIPVRLAASQYLTGLPITAASILLVVALDGLGATTALVLTAAATVLAGAAAAGRLVAGARQPPASPAG
ncbi:hypothetical protein [Jiangella sp. DSM 45060]|uniref:hypothetical protein n=1 Tax=Jiangella sp. DSM 45060 TaxID=1798224 RepID=UPI0008797CEC|nr:hypothetical protein [Jiangella sp. DSM 45060]SDS52133.1 hypothetical protein SAMN04515669_1281 [Jiangella sp. DSM 45060]